MPEKLWKVAERKVAEFFGTKRNPLSGAVTHNSASDTLHETLYLEVKQSKRFSVVSIWEKAREKATKERKTPVVALVEKGRPGFFIVVHSCDLCDVAEVRMKVGLEEVFKCFKDKDKGGSQ